MVLQAMLLVVMPTTFAVVAVLCVSAAALYVLGGLFSPGLRYRITSAEQLRNDSEHFLCVLEALTDAKANCRSSFEVLTNGDVFYQAQLAAIDGAVRNVNLEAYIFDRGVIGARYVEALTKRAAAGVRVNVLCDAFGSLGVSKRYFQSLLEAGGNVAWYNSPRWYRLDRIDNRTHRELMIVDGRMGFIGGAGVADQWYKETHGQPRWRDSMLRVHGDAVTSLQATFAENWLEACGEVQVGEEYFQAGEQAADGSVALVVNSTPSMAGSTRARILFQMLLASASESIHLTTPYFLPDKSLTEELIRAVQERGVEVTILVPGAKSDHMLTRSASRRGYGPLLKAGAKVYEYQPTMIHAKILLIDGLWSVVGSTNFDNRSFGINDEVNMAVKGSALSARLEQDFQADLKSSRALSYNEWRSRPAFERIPELLGWILQQQQ